MSKHPLVACGIGVLVFIGTVGLACLVILILSGGLFAPFEVAWHLLTGSVYFLQKNIAGISTDAGTWGPGIAAFLLALTVIHGFGRSWARHRQAAWRISTTLALGMMLPLLFAISFLVPGVFLQVRQLANAPWLARGSGEPSYIRQQLQILGLHLIDATADDKHYPDSLEILIDRNLIKTGDLFPPGQYMNMPREPVLYLGKGLVTTSDSSLPLLVSPPYSQGGARKRMVLTIGHETVVIPDDELDAWIKRAMAARDGVK